MMIGQIPQIGNVGKVRKFAESLRYSCRKAQVFPYRMSRNCYKLLTSLFGEVRTECSRSRLTSAGKRREALCRTSHEGVFYRVRQAYWRRAWRLPGRRG